MFCPFKRNHWTVIKTREGRGARGSTELAAPFLGNNHIQPIIECLDSATTRISDDKIKILFALVATIEKIGQIDKKPEFLSFLSDPM